MRKITISLDGEAVKEVTLDKPRMTIGRRPHNDIVLDLRAISAEHAALVMEQTNCFVEDLHSTNGTLVNGQAVQKYYLQHGDVIQLAKYEIRYFNVDAQHSEEKLPAPIWVNDFADTESLKQFDTSPPLRGDTNIAGMIDGVPQPMPFIKIKTGPSAGKEMILSKSLTTIGRPGVQVAVITRRPQGFLITHVEGDTYPLVDGASIGVNAHPLVPGNVVNLSGTEIEFLLR